MNKTWFITGTSSGFGRLMTEKLLARGDTVVATLRRTGALEDLQAQYANRLQVLELDAGRIVEFTFFLDTATLFPLFGLPARLDS